MTDTIDTARTPDDRTEQSLGALSRLSVKQAGVRVHDEPAFVLATWPWKESSVIAECLTRHHGRVVVAVRGVKRPGSQFRGLINPFSPLMIGYCGAQEVKKLTHARWMGGLPTLTGESLLTGFYLNELVVNLTAREDPNAAVFDLYVDTLSSIAKSERPTAIQRVLREFELELLRLCGWAVTLVEGDAAGRCRVVDGRLETLAADVPVNADECVVSYETARAIVNRDFSHPPHLKAARDVLRAIIRYHVGNKELLTRRTVTQWQLF